MAKRPPIIAVRPRKGSVLEAQQKALNNDMADIIHSWASQFAEMAAASEQGEKINEPNQS
jgi:hypothetical protein